MFKTRVTQILGIEYPIIGGTMQWLSVAKLVAAQSNAGCLGVLSSATHSSKEDLKKEIRKVKALTDKPFAVNVSLFPSMRPFPVEDVIDAAHEEGVTIIETSGRSPEPYIERIRKPGVIHIHKCARVRDAKKAEALGADIVTVVGFECAGHPSADDVPAMVLIPRVVDAVKVPVVAGGGIADGRGFVAALALGAEGVIMGTRFVATQECEIHQRFKEALEAADITDTVLVCRSFGEQVRLYRNGLARQILEMERGGVGLEEILPLMSGLRGLEAYIKGDLDAGVFPIGQSAGLVKKVKTVKEVVDDIFDEARQVWERMAQSRLPG